MNAPAVRTAEISTNVVTERSPTSWLSPESFEAAERISSLMSKMGTMPIHLVGKPADCFRIVVQAAKWQMDPFAVAECTSLVHGRLCYEGKLISAVLTSMNAIEGRLDYEFTGKGQEMAVTVTGTPRGGRKQAITGTVKDWRTRTIKDGKELPNAWDKDPQSMLVYRGTRQWARLFAPGAILGVYAPDELEESELKTVEGTVIPETRTGKVRDVEAFTEPATGASAPEATPPAPNPVDELVRLAKDLHTEFGKPATERLTEICGKLQVAKISNCPVVRIPDAIAMVKSAWRELHEVPKQQEKPATGTAS